MKKIIIPLIAVIVLFAVLSLLGRGKTKPAEQTVSPTAEVSTTVTPEVTAMVQQEKGAGTSESETLTLEISSPQNGSTVSSSTVTVTGKTRRTSRFL